MSGRWQRNPFPRLHCPSPILRKDDGTGGYKFVHLSTSNYEMAREVDMNMAAIDMEDFRSHDLDSALKLAYSSPSNTGSMLKVSDSFLSSLDQNER